MQQALLWAAAGTGFTFSMTALGAAMVFFMKKQSTALMQRIFLGFAAGVMIAASVWSLLIPAIEETEQAGGVGWLPASGGFVLGILLMLLLDGLLPHLHNGAARAEGLPSSFRRTTLLVLAVTLHNIPEGMAVGLSFARAAQHGGSRGLVAAAGALALGIGIQNFPEGAAVALPLHQEGLSPDEILCLWRTERHRRAAFRCCGRPRLRAADAVHAVAALRRRRCNAVCRRRGADPGSAFRRAFSLGYARRHGRLSRDDDTGRCARISKTQNKRSGAAFRLPLPRFRQTKKHHPKMML